MGDGVVVRVVPPLTLDGPSLHCAFETWWCRAHSAEAGGFDVHHRWPVSLGGPAEPTDAAGLLILCPTHHRREHALVRAYVEADPLAHGTLLTEIRTVQHYTGIEDATAQYAYAQWVGAGRPKIEGWPCPAAVVRKG